MLPPVVTKSVEHLTSSIFNLVAILIATTIFALILTHFLGIKSQAMRQPIVIACLCAVAYFVIPKLFGMSSS